MRNSGGEARAAVPRSDFRLPRLLLPLVRLPEGMHAEGLFDLGVLPPQVVAHAVGRDGVPDRHVPPGERAEQRLREHREHDVETELEHREFSRVLPYTMIHICAFIIVGTVAAALAAEVEVAPPTLYLIVVSFAVFEFGFYIMLAVLAQPLLGALAWWNVAIGNAIAAYGMGYYLWREHPKIKEALRVHPLGETDEGE